MAWTRKGGKTAAPASVAAPAPVATPKNTQASSSGKITNQRRKSTRQEGHQTFLVTLKRAYNERSRIDLDFPHIFKKACRKEQRARTRKSANSRGNRSTDETASANTIDPAPNVQYDLPNFKLVTNTDIIETHRLGKSDSLHFQPAGTQIGVVYKPDKIETVDGTASGKSTGDFLDASLFTPLTPRLTSPRKGLHLDVKSSQDAGLEKMTNCLNPENAYIGTNFDQFQEVYKSVGSLENFGNYERSMQSSPLTTDFSYTASTGINTPANGNFSSAYGTPFTTTLANNLALVSQLEMSQLNNSVLNSLGLCDFNFSYPVQDLDDLSYNDVCTIRGDENKEENDEAPVLPYSEDDFYDILINP